MALRRDPSRTCVITDFDGTLSAIVSDPASARPLEGAPAALRGLAERYGRVAVVSGRPAGFLAGRLGLQGRPLPPSLRVVGLYGLEALGPDGRVQVAPGSEDWRDVVAEAADRAEVEAAPGVTVERKGLSVTLHWRNHPEAEAWAQSFLSRAASELGLAVHPARKSGELRPPLDIDKGTVVSALAEGFDTVCYLGDDMGDLPAFAALDGMAARGTTTVKVAVSSPEAPAELLAAADLVLDGPPAALGLLVSLTLSEA